MTTSFSGTDSSLIAFALYFRKNLFLHTKESFTDDGILMAASSNEQARRAVELIGDCELIELSSNHDIHRFNPKVFLDAILKMQ